VVLLTGFVAATMLVWSGPAAATKCVPSVGTFIGRLIAMNGRSVTYRVESFEPGSYFDASIDPPPTPGRPFVVRYGRYDTELLRVGRRYSVVTWAEYTPTRSAFKGYFADVATAGRVECGGGTMYAGGSQIDTALANQPHVIHAALVLGVVSAAGAALYAVYAARRRKRQRENVDELLRLGA
jgi:hypothetical protein